MNATTRRATLSLGAIVATAGILAGVATVSVPAQGSLSAYRQRLRDQMSYARQKKHEAEDEAAKLRKDLRAAEQRLEYVQGQVRRTQARIGITKDNIVRTSELIQQREQEIAGQETLVDTRIVALHKTDSTSFLGAFLGSEDFTDVIECAYVGKKILNSDLDLLRELKAKRREAEQAKQRLKTMQKDLEEDEVRLKQAQREAAAATEQKKQLVEKQNELARQWQQKLDSLAAESQSIEAMLRGTSVHYSGVWRGSWLRPCGGPITSGYGMRFHPIARVRRQHNGVDIGASSGSAVCAAGDGLVVSAGWRGGYGNCIIVDHGGGRATLYAHLSAFRAGTGATVRRGQVIGSVGSTGYSTGPHLHFEVRINGTPVNPLG